MVIFYENDRGKEGVWGRKTQLIICPWTVRGQSAGHEEVKCSLDDR